MASSLALLGGQSVGLVLAILFVLASSEAIPGSAGLAWSAAAGLSGAIGLLGFYRALASRQMSLAAPLVAVIGAAIPAVVALAFGDALSPAQLAGIVCALAAIVIVSSSGGAPLAQATAVGSGGQEVAAEVGRSWAGIVLAGLGFAGFYLAMHQAIEVSGETWWPLLAARVTTVALSLLLVALARPSLRLTTGAVALLLVVGAGDYGGNAFFVLASQQGSLSVAVILSSLYPVTTVLLAATMLHERLGRWQLAGALLALAGVVLIAI